MAKCPSCQHKISKTDRQTGTCPECGAHLPALSETAMPPLESSSAATEAPVVIEIPPELAAPRGAATIRMAATEAPDADRGPTAAPGAALPEVGTASPRPQGTARPAAPVTERGDSTDLGTAVPPPPAGIDDAPFDANRTVDPRIDAEKTIIEMSLSASPDATIAAQGTFNASITAAMDKPAQTQPETGAPQTRPKKSGVLLEDSLVIQPRGVRRVPGEVAPTCDYDVSKLIGEGGMGMVYQARQASLDREVALKMIKPRELDEAARARYSANELERVEQTLQRRDREWFLSEAMVTANLEHPYIVPVYDVIKDRTNSLYYAMKWVRGTPWNKIIRDKGEADNLEILMKVADAVAFAHDKGIIHRDLKPENVMVGAHGEVYVMDWGAALVTPDFDRATNLSQSSSGFGSPLYAAPELFLGTVDQIGVRSDVYLLGAVLFEVITGNPPHPYPSSRSEVLSILRTNQIRPTDYKGELLDISLKAMATNQDHRYPNVQEFQLAIREYQQHANSRTLSKRARSTLVKAEQTGDYTDYQRAVFAYDEAYALWHGNEDAREGVGQARLAYAGAALKKGDFNQGLEVADEKDPAHREVIGRLRAAQRDRESQKRRLQTTRRAAAILAAMFLIGLSVATYWINKERAAAVIAEKAAKESEKVAIAAREKEAEAKVAALDAAKAEEKAKDEALVARDDAKTAQTKAEISADEERKAKVAEADARKVADAKRQEADEQRQIAEENERKAVAAKAAQEYEAYIAEIGLADSKIKTSAFDDVRRVLKGIRDEEQKREAAAAPAAVARSLRGWEFDRLEYLAGQAVPLVDGAKAAGARDLRVEALAVDRTGQKFVAGRRDGTAVIGSTAAGANAPLVVLDAGRPVLAVAFSPDGKLIATGGDSGKEGSVQLWSADGKPLGQPFGGGGKAVYSVQFGQRLGKTWLLTAGADFSAQVWDVSRGAAQPVGSPLVGHYGAVRSAIFSPDASLIVTVGDDFRTVVWGPVEAANGLAFEMKRAIRFHDSPVLAAAWSADGKKVVSADEDGRLIVWNPAGLGVKSKTAGAPAASGAQNDAKNDRGESAILHANLGGHDKAVRAVAFSSDGNYLLSGGDDNTVKLQRLRAKDESGKPEDVKTFRGHGGHVHACLLVSLGEPTDAVRPGVQNWFVLSGGHDSMVMRWNVAAYKEEQVFHDSVLVGTTGPDRDVLSAAFSPDGASVVTGSRDHKAYQWNVRTGEKREFNLAPTARKLDEGHSLPIWTAAYAPDGSWFLTAGMDDTSLLWHRATGTQWARLPKTGIPAVVAVSPDGQWIVTSASESSRGTAGAASPRVQFWNVNDLKNGAPVAARREVVQPVERQGQLTALAFAPDADLRLYSGFECKSPSDAAGGGLVWELRQVDGYPQWVVVKSLPARTQINSAALLPGGIRLLTAGDDGNVTINDLASDSAAPVGKLVHGTPVRFVGLHQDGITAITVNAVKPPEPASGKRAAPVSEYDLHRWDLASAHEIQNKSIRFDTPTVFSVALAPQGDEALIVAAAPAGQPGTVVRRFSLDTGDELTRQGNRPYLDSKKDVRQFWGAVYAPPGPDGAADKQILALHGSRAELYDGSAKLVNRSIPHGQVRSVGYSSDGKFVLTAGTDGTIKVWDAESRGAVCKLDNPHGNVPSSIQSASFSPVKGSYQILSAGRDKMAKLWDWDGKAAAPAAVRTWKHDSDVRSAAFSSDGRRVVCGCEDGTAWIWKSDNDQQPIGKTAKWDPAKAAEGGHQGPILTAAFSNKSSDWIITGGEDNLAHVWSVGDAVKMHSVLKGHAAAVRCAAFSPDDRRVVTGSGDTFAKLWDPRLPVGEEAAADDDDRNARELLTLSRHERAVTTVAFSPRDGATVLTASSDGNTVLWLSTPIQPEQK